MFIAFYELTLNGRLEELRDKLELHAENPEEARRLYGQKRGPKPKNQVQCDVCEQYFWTDKLLKNHKCFHSRDKAYK